jgi:hypothetical protein
MKALSQLTLASDSHKRQLAGETLVALSSFLQPHAQGPLGYRPGRGILAGRQTGGVCI